MSEQETSAAAETTNEAGANGGENGQATAAASENSEGQSQSTGAENLLTGAKQSDGEGSEENAGEKKAENGDEKSKEVEKKEEAEQGAPEQYEEFKAPEGLSYDDQFMGTFKDVAKELNLSQKQAQHLLDKCAPVLAQRQVEQIKAVSDQWVERTRSDKEIGGTNWTRAASDIARVRDRFGVNADGKMDPDIAEFMSTPIGNHPGLLKLLARVGRAFGEAGFPKGGNDSDGKIRLEDIYKLEK
jgi:hypothetical protein